MNKELIEDIIEWDIKNWSKALEFWLANADISSKEGNCLELGGRRGGLSLLLALSGNRVICSDLESPKDIASDLHKKYKLNGRIKYQGIDATDIPYENEFDIVIFKSILGGISANGKDELKKKALNEIHKSLKPTGKLLFAENLEASVLHKSLRGKFIKWGNRWNYMKYNDIKVLFSEYSNIEFQTFGFFGTFGRSEKQRKLLGFIDSMISPLVPKKNKYILVGVATK